MVCLTAASIAQSLYLSDKMVGESGIVKSVKEVVVVLRGLSQKLPTYEATVLQTFPLCSQTTDVAGRD
jgi:hypothetical protein